MVGFLSGGREGTLLCSYLQGDNSSRHFPKHFLQVISVILIIALSGRARNTQGLAKLIERSPPSPVILDKLTPSFPTPPQICSSHMLWQHTDVFKATSFEPNCWGCQTLMAAE